jgi:DNA-binding response OmpR family regulator
MVVDDNSVNRIVTRRLLDSIGCIPTVVDSGQKCLDILIEKGASAFQIILLDLCMPEVGLAFLRSQFCTIPFLYARLCLETRSRLQELSNTCSLSLCLSLSVQKLTNNITHSKVR